jgi:hypothetical protein
MASVTITKLLATIGNIGQSATALAKKLGLSKGSQIQGMIDELVDDGSVEKDESGRFVLYKKASKKASAKSAKKTVAATSAVAVTPVESAPSVSDADCSVIPESGKIQKMSKDMDADATIQLDGYSVVKPATNKSGQVGARVTLPIKDSKGKNKTVFVKEGMTLVVINDKPCYMVNSPAKLIIACHTYAKENGLSTYAIEQAKVGVISGVDDVVMSDVVSMKIKKIDKGA